MEKKAKDGFDLNSENLEDLPAAGVSGMDGGSVGLKSEDGNEAAMMSGERESRGVLMSTFLPQGDGGKSRGNGQVVPLKVEFAEIVA